MKRIFCIFLGHNMGVAKCHGEVLRYFHWVRCRRCSNDDFMFGTCEDCPKRGEKYEN